MKVRSIDLITIFMSQMSQDKTVKIALTQPARKINGGCSVINVITRAMLREIFEPWKCEPTENEVRMCSTIAKTTIIMAYAKTKA